MFSTEAGQTDPQYLKDPLQHIYEPSPDDKILDIAVIGAGIAGLAAAAGLCRSGHRVQVSAGKTLGCRQNSRLIPKYRSSSDRAFPTKSVQRSMYAPTPPGFCGIGVSTSRKHGQFPFPA